MVTKRSRNKLILVGAVIAGSCVLYHRLTPNERSKFKRSLKQNSVLFLLNLLPYAIKAVKRVNEATKVVPGPTPYATIET